ncbi:uncharacterized protein LOC144701693 [Wolffia australiana]
MVLIGTSNLAAANRLGFVVLSDSRDEKGRKRHCSQQKYLELRSLRMEPAAGMFSEAPKPVMLTSGPSSRVSAVMSLRTLRALLMLLNMILLALLSPLQRGAARLAIGRRSVDRTKGSERKRKLAAPMAVRTPAARRADVAFRRAMAIRRLAMEEDDSPASWSRKEFSLFATTRGDTLFTRSWSPIDAPIRGLVLVLHGLNEHSGRYNLFARRLNRSGLKAYAMDWTGHGGSDGLHGYVHSLDYAVEDAKLFLEKIFEENPGLPCFCFGHSTGAAIILKAALDPKVEARLRGVVLTSPAIRVQPTHRILAMVAPIVSLLLPRYQLSAAEKKGTAVSRDPAAVAAKYSDPLVFTGALRVRTGYEILRITSYLQRNLGRVNVPFMALHGTEDTVTDPVATQLLHQAAPSKDKSVKLYDGLLHDLLFEPEGIEIAEDVVAWMVDRVGPSP